MIRCLLVLFIFPFSVYAQQNDLIDLPSNSDINILYVGDYKVGELDTSILSDEWWGLYEKNNKSYIKKVTVIKERIEPDIQYDWAYRISVDDNKYCIFLISGLELNNRYIEHFTNNDIIRDNQKFTFEFNLYHTYLSSKLEKNEIVGDTQISYYSIVLNYESNQTHRSQPLFLFPCYNSQLHITLIWAGDLDNDGKTDFLINIPTLPNNEIGFSSGLYLSSKAENEKLVKLVAFHSQKGC